MTKKKETRGDRGKKQGCGQTSVPPVPSKSVTPTTGCIYGQKDPMSQKLFFCPTGWFSDP